MLSCHDFHLSFLQTYTGLGPNLLGVSHGAIQILFYEKLKERIAQNNSSEKMVRMVNELASGMLHCFATFLDHLRHPPGLLRLQGGRGSHNLPLPDPAGRPAGPGH